MATSPLTDKGQTTVPQVIGDALKVKPRQRLISSMQAAGLAIVRPQGSALALFGSLKAPKRFPGQRAQRAAVARAVGKHAAREGTAY